MTIIVKNVAKKFDKGVSAAKQLGGTFDGTNKVWRLCEERVVAAKGSDTMNTLAEWLGYRGLRLVETSVTASPVRHDASCPALMGGACECR